MKFIFSAEINLPAEKVFDLFLNKDNLKEWQTEFINCELISGTPGKAGAVTKQNYKSVIIIETIASINFPHEIRCLHDHKRNTTTIMTHETSNRFKLLTENKTLFEMEMLNVEFVGFLPKLMSKLMGKMFEKYHQEEVDHFKLFAERTFNPTRV
jgi:hypothetical protein